MIYRLHADMIDQSSTDMIYPPKGGCDIYFDLISYPGSRSSENIIVVGKTGDATLLAMEGKNRYNREAFILNEGNHLKKTV